MRKPSESFAGFSARTIYRFRFTIRQLEDAETGFILTA
jgi:hypothetical protein